jgi:preprotein translocase subunit YajC
MTMQQPPAGPAPMTPSSTSTAPTPPAPAAVVRPRRSSNRLLDVALVAAAALAIGGVAFGIGRATAPAAAFTGGGIEFPGGRALSPNGSFDPNAGPRVGFGGGPTIDGTVTAIDRDTLTVKLADDTEMTFTLDSTTAYHQATEASASDVTVGDGVSVRVKGGARVAVGADPSAAPTLSASDVTVTR